MTNLIVLTFDSTDEAEEVHKALVQGKKQGLLAIRDAAVVVKDQDGKVHVKNQVSTGTWTATGVGGLLGVLIGAIFFPVGGLILGLAGGALVGRFMNLGVDGKFVKEVQNEIQPGSSALFVLTDADNIGGELAILRNHKGKVLQTNLPSEQEDALRDALGDKTQA